jgi:alkanesulfonate monooxygenase SsuD/methylene tetrahydromethanopterin reductase-like flavin-dependent oxidoreductase (luciferase family)
MERIGVALSMGLPPRDIVECVGLAEELGYESAWMAEGHGGDQFSILTACAVATEKILLGTSITSVFVRTPPTIAMAAACVDHFSKGRFILGVGSSHRVQVEGEHGLVFGQPIARVRECVEIVRTLLREDRVSFRGEVYDIEGFDLWFKPYRKEIPVFVAAVFPKMLEVCGEMAQGTMLTSCTLDRARGAVEHVASGARRAGRDPAEVDVSTLIRCGIGEDPERAADGMRPGLAMYAARFPRYRRMMMEAGFADEVQASRRAWEEGDQATAQRLLPVELLDTIGIVGAAEHARRRIEQYREAGITLPIISPAVSGSDDPKAQVMEILRACAPR